MKWLKRIGLGIASLVAIAVIGIGALYFWLASAALEAPPLGNATQAQVYDDAYLAAITAASTSVTEARTNLSAPGITVAVSIGGELVWEEVQGLADIESAAPLTLGSRFIIGSVSKTITATAAARLWEQGLLDLDADIHTYLPDYPALPYTLTTRQLLSHQGGIRHYAFAMNPPVFSESGMNTPYATTQDALSIFSEDELLFEPDTDFQYSTYGYTLVAAVLEAASGQDFLSLLQAEVFDPARMPNTSADYQDRPVPDRVSDYVTLMYVDGLLPAPASDPSYKWAGGGLVSTSADLVRFGTALLEGELVSPETRDVMFTARTTSDGEINPQYYGLGWREGGMYYPRGSESLTPMINHGGTSIGGVAILMIYPEHDMVVAMTANVTPPGGSGPLRSAAAEVARTFLDHMSTGDPE